MERISTTTFKTVVVTRLAGVGSQANIPMAREIPVHMSAHENKNYCRSKHLCTFLEKATFLELNGFIAGFIVNLEKLENLENRPFFQKVRENLE